MEIHAWQEEFTINASMDHQEVVAQLSDIQESQGLIQNKVDNNTAKLLQMMALLQMVKQFHLKHLAQVHITKSSLSSFFSL